MNQQELENLLYQLRIMPRECEWLEFKVSNHNPHEIGEYISSLSNSACYHNQQYGYLVFGIEDQSHNLVGTTFYPAKEKQGSQELENWIATQLKPRIDFRIYESNINEKHIVIFKIDATYHTPVKFRGNSYIRIGTYKKLLSEHPERERKIWQKASETNFEKQSCLEAVNGKDILNLIDHKSLFALLDLPIPKNGASLLEKLEENKLIEKDDGLYNVTNLGGILFANDLKRFEAINRKAIRVIFYSGNSRITTQKEVAKELIGEKGYAVGFNGLIKYLVERLPSSEVIEDGLRKQVHVFPSLALRELIANALIHQDFSIRGTSPMIEVFHDRIEITNPGRPLIDPLRFMDHSPESRNELLAMTMRRMNICEERGTGIDKVVHSCEIFKLPAPDFIVGDNFTRVILYSPARFKQMDKKDKIRTCYQHCCLLYLSGDFMTNETLRQRLGIEDKNYSIASRIISDAKEEGLIKETDPENRSRKYEPFYA